MEGRGTDLTSPSASMRGLWALGFVTASLIALVAMPIFFGRRVDALQDRIADVLEPTARHSSNLALLLSRQMARVEGYLLTGDRVTFREPYIAAIAEKDQVLEDLSALASAVDPEVFDRVARLDAESLRWDFENQRLFDTIPPPNARANAQRRYEELREATRQLNRAIASSVDQARRDIREARTLQGLVTVGLAVLALIATVVVARVGYRYRELTIEGEIRRRDAVRARREMDSLLEATGDGVLGIDLDGRCISLNRAGVLLLGYTEREIVGRDVHETLFHSAPDGTPSPRGESRVLEALVAGEPIDSQAGDVIWRRRRIAFPARWSLRPLVDGVELRGAVLTFTDMTEIREKEEALRRAIQLREDVVSIVSHDLRNPLGVALAAADLLLDLPLDEAQRRRQAEIIARSGRRMQSLIDDLLDVARIEAGALIVRPSLEELVPILEEAREVFQDQAERKRIALSLRVGEGSLEARVDRDRILQALANLLDNALRLTPEAGSVVLAVDDLGEELALTVSDTGPGIAPELLGRLFDRFSQEDGVGKGGAGLGLAIVEGVATAHRGSVTVTSRLGEGTAFTMRLPKAGPPVGEQGARSDRGPLLSA